MPPYKAEVTFLPAGFVLSSYKYVWYKEFNYAVWYFEQFTISMAKCPHNIGTYGIYSVA